MNVVRADDVVLTYYSVVFDSADAVHEDVVMKSKRFSDFELISVVGRLFGVCAFLIFIVWETRRF